MARRQELFEFKRFKVHQDKCTMKVNTDAIILGAWSDVSGKSTALDIGTGTGVLALMLAQKSEMLNVIGIEIDQEASAQAAYNMAISPFSSQLKSISSSIQSFASNTDEVYDLIISNPPFFSGGTFSYNENKTFVRHTVKLPHADLLRAVSKLLHPNGHFDLILPYVEGLRFIELASQYRLYPQRVMEVFGKQGKNQERLLIRMQRSVGTVVYEEPLIIFDSLSNYTQQFRLLTESYYLDKVYTKKVKSTC